MSAEELQVLRQSKLAFVLGKAAVYFLALRRQNENGMTSAELEEMGQTVLADGVAFLKEWREIEEPETAEDMVRLAESFWGPLKIA